jgi:ribosomal-protein-alanine N-acetyltransferase
MRPLGWPAVMSHGPITVRGLRLRDAGDWRQVRVANREWLAPWEATTPGQRADDGNHSYFDAVRVLRSEARAGVSLPFALLVDDQFAGQITVGAISRGSANSAYLGYWIARGFAGRGIMPTALALVVDHCFGPVRLHRVEANIRPENAASRRVVEKLGFRAEGTRERYIHIADEVRDGLLRRWLAQGGDQRIGR